MRISDAAIAKLKEFEGLRLQSYQCSAGVWTIGYGHTTGVTKGQTINEQKADEYLRDDLNIFERYINGLGLHLNQHQFDSLVDFTFNLGVSALAGSTLLKKIRANAPIAEIQAQFKKWVYAGGKKLAGLVRRREWEANWYAS